MKNFLSCRTRGSQFLIIGSAFGAIGFSGQPNFLPVAFGCIVLGLLTQVRARRKPSA